MSLNSDRVYELEDSAEFQFWSSCNSYGLRFKRSGLDGIIRSCKSTYPNETGGILIGSYTVSLDCALATNVTKAPPDSKSGKTWFRRGIRGLKRLLDTHWNSREFYLGEWHFHPNGEPDPSLTDRQQLERFSLSSDVNCTEPILLIFGGNPSLTWKIRVFVFPRNRSYLEMHYLDHQS